MGKTFYSLFPSISRDLINEMNNSINFIFIYNIICIKKKKYLEYNRNLWAFLIMPISYITKTKNNKILF